MNKYFTATVNGIPGLKYLAVFLKWIVYGEVTILIPLDSASTISLPVGWCRNMYAFTHKLMMQSYILMLKSHITNFLSFLQGKCYTHWIYMNHIWLNTHFLSLTALSQHTDRYIYGAPIQVNDVFEGLCNVLSLQSDLPFTFYNLMWYDKKKCLVITCRYFNQCVNSSLILNGLRSTINSSKL